MDNQRTARTMGRPHLCRHSSRERKERPERGLCVDIPRMPPCAMNERHAPTPHIVRQWWEDGHPAHSITPQMAYGIPKSITALGLSAATIQTPRKRKTKHRAHFSAAQRQRQRRPRPCHLVVILWVISTKKREGTAKTSDIFPILSDIFSIPSDIFSISSHGMSNPEPLFQRAKA